MTGLGLPSIVVTIGTMSLFRGIAFIVLGDQAYKGYPASFAFFGQGYVWWVVSFELVLFLVAAVRLRLPPAPDELRPPHLRHRQQPDRRALLRRPGRPHQVHPVLPDRPDVRHRRRCCITSRLGSTRPSIAQGYELEVDHHGGARRRQHPRRLRQHPRRRLAAFIMGLVTFGLGLLNVPGIVMSIFIGLLLIVVIALPIVWRARWPGARLMPEKYAFRMQLNPGMKAEYSRRHDEIWPELVALLKEAGVSDYSIHLDEETNMLFGVLWRRDGHTHGRPAEASGDAALVGAYGRHHGDKAGQRAGGGAAGNRLPHGMTMAAPPRRRHRHRQDQRQGGAGRSRALCRDRPCRKTPNAVLTDGPYPHFDVERALELHPRKPRARSTASSAIDAISVTTHGAAAALLDADGDLALPVLDYEYDGPDSARRRL